MILKEQDWELAQQEIEILKDDLKDEQERSDGLSHEISELLQEKELLKRKIKKALEWAEEKELVDWKKEGKGFPDGINYAKCELRQILTDEK